MPIISDACEAGYYRSGDMEACTQCQGNSVSAGGAGSCTPCTGGSEANSEKTECGESLPKLDNTIILNETELSSQKSQFLQLLLSSTN